MIVNNRNSGLPARQGKTPCKTIDVPRIGIFAANDAAAHHLAECMRMMGGNPVKIHGYDQLSVHSPVLTDLDCAVVCINSGDRRAKLSRDTEEFIDLLFSALSARPEFSAIIITPMAMASMVSYIFEGRKVTILVDPSDSDVCSGIVQMMRCCAAGMAEKAALNIEQRLRDSAAFERGGSAGLIAGGRAGEADDYTHALSAERGEEGGESFTEGTAIADQLQAVTSKIDAMLARLPELDKAEAAALLKGREGIDAAPCECAPKTSEMPVVAPPPPPIPAPRGPLIDDAKFLRSLVTRRQQRMRMFGDQLFGDPAWEMLLDLAVARAENKPISVSSLCIASGVPHTTALRWISKLVDAGLFIRAEDENDKRRVFVMLSQKAVEGLNRYFEESIAISRN